MAKVMDTYPKDEYIQTLALEMLSELLIIIKNKVIDAEARVSSSSSSSSSEVFMVIDSVLKAMKMYPSVRAIQMVGTRCVRNLCANENMAGNVIMANAHFALQRIIRDYEGDVLLQTYACQAFVEYLEVDGSANKVRVSGLHKDVIGLMKRLLLPHEHEVAEEGSDSESEDKVIALQIAGCAVIDRFCLNIDCNLSIGSENVHEILQSVMIRYPEDSN